MHIKLTAAKISCSSSAVSQSAREMKIYCQINFAKWKKRRKFKKGNSVVGMQLTGGKGKVFLLLACGKEQICN